MEKLTKKIENLTALLVLAKELYTIIVIKGLNSSDKELLEARDKYFKVIK